MENLEGKIIKFEDGREAYVLEMFEYEGKSYIYIASREGLEPAFAELKEVDGVINIEKVTDVNLKKLFKAYLLKIYTTETEENN